MFLIDTFRVKEGTMLLRGVIKKRIQSYETRNGVSNLYKIGTAVEKSQVLCLLN